MKVAKNIDQLSYVGKDNPFNVLMIIILPKDNYLQQKVSSVHLLKMLFIILIVAVVILFYIFIFFISLYYFVYLFHEVK